MTSLTHNWTTSAVVILMLQKLFDTWLKLLINCLLLHYLEKNIFPFIHVHIAIFRFFLYTHNYWVYSWGYYNLRFFYLIFTFHFFKFFSTHKSTPMFLYNYCWCNYFQVLSKPFSCYVPFVNFLNFNCSIILNFFQIFRWYYDIFLS